MGTDYTPQPNFTAAADKVKAPAITIIAVTGIGILLQIVSMIARLVGVGMASMPSNLPPDQARIVNMMSGGLGVVGAVVAILVGGFIIFGAMKMMNLQAYGLALAAAIVVMLPCLSPCCCLGIPAGIWALVVLMNAEVKAAFR